MLFSNELLPIASGPAELWRLIASKKSFLLKKVRKDSGEQVRNRPTPAEGWEQNGRIWKTVQANGCLRKALLLTGMRMPCYKVFTSSCEVPL